MGLWFFPAWGFLLWLIATVVMRVTGEHLLDPDQVVVTFLVFAGTLPLIAAVTLPIYDWRQVNLQDRPTAAILMSLPGLFIDILVLLLFSRIYPNLGDTGALFGAWLLWAYGLVLISGLLPYNRLWKV
jgi:hypothetical protein